jgi:hypothetical protein
LLIKDERAIDLVRDEKKPLREISCGYDAEYVQVEPGIAYQRQIIGNHVALVERGRAGPRCSIQDEETMPQSKPKTGMSALFAKMIRAMRTGDQALLARVADEAAEEQERIEDEEREAAEAEAKKQTADTIAELKKTVDELESKVAELQAKVGDDDTEELDENGQPKAKTGDNDGEPTDEEKTKTEDAMRDTMPRAEILVPGFTVDAAPKRPADVVALQRKVLRAADAAALQPLLAGRTVDALPDDAVATVFIAAAEMKRATNNARAQVPGRTQDHRGQPGAVTAAEINRRNAEFYKQSN